MKLPVKRVLPQAQRFGKQSRRYFNFQEALAKKDALLFTPGPLSTSKTVKEAMLHDWGSRDSAMINVIQSIRTGLLEVANVSPEEYTTVIVQGSGTMGVESTITSCIPPNGKLLVLKNGAYGDRAQKIADTAGIKTTSLQYAENDVPCVAELDKLLTQDSDVTHVLCIHSETTSGVVNPVEKVAEIAQKHGKKVIIDAMSSFGAIPVDFSSGIDYLVSSSNKCLEGVPGFSYAIARKSAIAETAGWARSVSLDLHAQMAGLDKNGQFRFTPPCHALIAFRQALEEFWAEGGVSARNARYMENQRLCIQRMREIGYETYLKPEVAGPIITSFLFPKSSNWHFETFYNKLAEREFLIYPGKVSNAECFRIGHIGHVFPSDTAKLMDAVHDVSQEMNLFSSQ